MRKEMLFSILIGLVFGLVVTYGVYRAQTALTSSKEDQTEVLNSPSPSDSPLETSGTLSIINPVDESVRTGTELTVTGVAEPDTFIVIFINDDEYITESDATGNYSITGELEQGANVITVKSISSDGTQESLERTVIVSDAPLDAVSADEASSSAETNDDE